jgi:hypothetical protein
VDCVSGSKKIGEMLKQERSVVVLERKIKVDPILRVDLKK